MDTHPSLPPAGPRRRTAMAAVAAIAGLGGTAARAQQGYPSRPIRVVVPYSAGGSSDAPMRVVAQELSQQMGQQVVVDNKPGQGGMIGGDAVAHAAPDGYTLLLASNPHVISASLYKNISFDPIADFVPVAGLCREPGILVVHPSLPVRSVAEFVAYVKARPGQVNYGSSGNGSAQHLFTASFAAQAGLDMVHVPYRGSAQVVTDLIAGQIPFALPGLAAMVSHVRDGKLRALAVTGSKRSPLLPDVPTLIESGFPGFTAYVWNGIMAPRGTPQAVVDRLNAEVATALRAPAVVAYMDKAAVEVIVMSPAEFGKFVIDEKNRAAKAVQVTGVHVD
ncbi:MAG: tripartite tricarboxylate transporter substrate binding protein [Pseudomonadota bacterium]